jgi:anthranilate phosphoribosyltransferase
MVSEVLERLLSGGDLDAETMEACFGALVGGEWSEAQQAAFLIALRAKGESAEEIAAAARVLRRFALPVATLRAPLIDTCGTGGDGAHTINISTGAALVAAACGVAVAKHGNRSVSSRCGSADVLEALGLPLGLEAEQVGALLDAEGFAFLFAPRFHPAMRAVMPVRRSLAVRTVFNLLGPLANPAGVTRQVVGVFAAPVMPLVAGALAVMGAERAWVVHGEDGLDEISLASPTRVLEVRDGQVTGELRVEPRLLGLAPDREGELQGGDPSDNARRLRAILAGDERSAAADAVALNGAAALVVAGVAEGLEDGLERCQRCLREGAAAAKLDAVVRRARELAA